YYFGGWTTVCQNQFSLREAEVVCRELQCGGAVKVRKYNNYFTYPHLNNVFCTGNEDYLRQCSFQEGGCRTNANVAVICAAPSSPTRIPANRTGNIMHCAFLQFANMKKGYAWYPEITYNLDINCDISFCF
ncbi:hypothetical protein E2320_008566, partial [Naja naja]